MHPVVLYYKDDTNCLKSRSLCIISDCMAHTSLQVAVFQAEIVKEIKNTLPFVEKLYYFTDGAGGQYKNRKCFANLSKHKEDYGLDAEWHFFATSHGKSPCDGVGGTVKRCVRRASLQRTVQNQILTALDVFNYCKNAIPGIQFFYIPQEKFDEKMPFYTARFESVKTVPKTRDYHAFIPGDQPGVLKLKKISSSQNFKQFQLFKTRCVQ